MKNYFNKYTAIILFAAGSIVTACTVESEAPASASSSPLIEKATPALAPSNSLITLTGKGLGEIQYITFSKGNIRAEINSTLNTESNLILRVPTTAIPGMQEIILKNSIGVETKIPFNVLGFPTIVDVSNYNFSKDSEITLTGKNLDDVTKVVLTGTTTEVAVKSKTATQLVVTMPTTTIAQATLSITNAAGTTATTQEFVSLDNAYKIFTEGYDNGYQDASWGSAGTISKTVSRTGTASVYKDYAKGNWHQLGFGWNGLSNNGFKFLSFWIKGGSKDYELFISTQTSKGGFAATDEPKKISVPANVWTYFKLPVAKLELWATGTSFNQIGWRIKGPDASDERFYIDDLIFIK
jgi:hypothetical protein